MRAPKHWKVHSKREGTREQENMQGRARTQTAQERKPVNVLVQMYVPQNIAKCVRRK